MFGLCIFMCILGLYTMCSSAVMGHKNRQPPGSIKADQEIRRTFGRVPSDYAFNRARIHTLRSVIYLKGLLGTCVYEYGERRKQCVANLVRTMYANKFIKPLMGRRVQATIDMMVYARKRAAKTGTRRGNSKSRKTYAGNTSQLHTNDDSLICRKEEFGFPPEMNAGVVDMATSMLCALCQVQTDEECVDIWCYIRTE